MTSGARVGPPRHRTELWTTHDVRRLRVSFGFVAESPAMYEALVLACKAAASPAGVMLVGECGTGRGFWPGPSMSALQTAPGRSSRRLPGVAAGRGRARAVRRARERLRRCAPQWRRPHHPGCGGGAPRLAPARRARWHDCLPQHRRTACAGSGQAGHALPRPRVQDASQRRRAVLPHPPAGHRRPGLPDNGRRRTRAAGPLPPVRGGPDRGPALRERREDVPGLAQQFVAAACQALSVEEKSMDAPSQTVLAALPWPGNVRELKDFSKASCRSLPSRRSRSTHCSTMLRSTRRRASTRRSVCRFARRASGSSANTSRPLLLSITAASQMLPSRSASSARTSIGSFERSDSEPPTRSRYPLHYHDVLASLLPPESVVARAVDGWSPDLQPRGRRRAVTPSRIRLVALAVGLLTGLTGNPARAQSGGQGEDGWSAAAGASGLSPSPRRWN